MMLLFYRMCVCVCWGDKSVYFGWDLASDDDDEEIEPRSQTRTRERQSVVGARLWLEGLHWTS